jgi:iron complex outermembrane receptor protein
MGSHYIKYMNQSDKTAPFENVVGKYTDSAAAGRGSVPKWKGLFDVAWSNAGIDAGVSANHITKLEAPTARSVGKTLPAWTTYDLRVGYDFLAYGKLTLGMNNVTDEEPPVTDAAANDNIDGRTHNLVGRFYYARWGVQL